jgi:hypothetical protein
MNANSSRVSARAGHRTRARARWPPQSVTLSAGIAARVSQTCGTLEAYGAENPVAPERRDVSQIAEAMQMPHLALPDKMYLHGRRMHADHRIAPNGRGPRGRVAAGVSRGATPSGGDKGYKGEKGESGAGASPDRGARRRVRRVPAGPA